MHLFFLTYIKCVANLSYLLRITETFVNKVAFVPAMHGVDCNKDVLRQSVTLALCTQSSPKYQYQPSFSIDIVDFVVLPCFCHKNNYIFFGAVV